MNSDVNDIARIKNFLDELMECELLAESSTLMRQFGNDFAAQMLIKELHKQHKISDSANIEAHPMSQKNYSADFKQHPDNLLIVQCTKGWAAVVPNKNFMMTKWNWDFAKGTPPTPRSGHGGKPAETNDLPFQIFYVKNAYQPSPIDTTGKPFEPRPGSDQRGVTRQDKLQGPIEKHRMGSRSKIGPSGAQLKQQKAEAPKIQVQTVSNDRMGKIGSFDMRNPGNILNFIRFDIFGTPTGDPYLNKSGEVVTDANGRHRKEEPDNVVQIWRVEGREDPESFDVPPEMRMGQHGKEIAPSGASVERSKIMARRPGEELHPDDREKINLDKRVTAVATRVSRIVPLIARTMRIDARRAGADREVLNRAAEIVSLDPQEIAAKTTKYLSNYLGTGGDIESLEKGDLTPFIDSIKSQMAREIGFKITKI